jgi:hypothetical protein
MVFKSLERIGIKVDFPDGDGKVDGHLEPTPDPWKLKVGKTIKIVNREKRRFHNTVLNIPGVQWVGERAVKPRVPYMIFSQNEQQVIRDDLDGISDDESRRITLVSIHDDSGDKPETFGLFRPISVQDFEAELESRGSEGPVDLSLREKVENLVTELNTVGREQIAY